MRNLKKSVSCLLTLLMLHSMASTPGLFGSSSNQNRGFNIGWASANITPDKPVLIQGQFYTRVSEGVMDPVIATALALESVNAQGASSRVIMVSCDLGRVDDFLRTAVNDALAKSFPEMKPEQIILFATHSHAAPYVLGRPTKSEVESKVTGIPWSELEAAVGREIMAPSDYVDFAAERIVAAAQQAWASRQPGGISYGFTHAVVSHSRLSVDFAGKSRLYGNPNHKEFSHMEGHEDHSVNLLYTWNRAGELTGVVINAPVPSQVSEHLSLISADFWYETRVELKKRLQRDIYILPQSSPAGGMSPHIMVDNRAENRMQKIMKIDGQGSGRGSIGRRQQIALRLADAVTSVLPYMKDHITWNPSFGHHTEIVKLSRRFLNEDHVKAALQEADEWEKQYHEELAKTRANPELKQRPRWYRDITRNYSRAYRSRAVRDYYELQKLEPRVPVDIHVIRIDDIVIATNPFELYLDYGIRMKVRSPAVQTFLVQFAASRSKTNIGYLPTARAVRGGGYGASPASTPIGPEGGQELVEETLRLIDLVWNKP